MSRKNIKRKPKAVSANKKADGPYFTKHPLSGIPQDVLLKGLREVGENSKEKFNALLEKVELILSSREPLQIISSLAAYGLFAGVTDDGTMPLGEKKFLQAHVELVQALSLKFIKPGSQYEAPKPEEIQELFENMPELGALFSQQRLAEIREDLSKEEKAIQQLQEHLRLHTQNVRNWGYFDRVHRIVSDLYAPLDEAFLQKLGISASDLIRTFNFLVRQIERNMTERFQMLRSVFSKRTPKEMGNAFCDLNPAFSDKREEILGVIETSKLNKIQTKSLLIYLSDEILAEKFIFSISSVAEQNEVDAKSLQSIFLKLGLQFGDLAESKPEHLFLDNPVWTKPLIHLGDDIFFCAMPQLFFAFIFSIFDELVSDNPDLRKLVEERRAKFLEDEIEKLLIKAFPNCEIVKNYKWKIGSEEYENDLLIRVDSHLFLIEAKSGRVSWPALRGAPERAKRHIEELFYSPSKQSSRLASNIKEVVDSSKGTSIFSDLNIRLDRVRTVVRLSVTLEDFAVVQTNIQMLRGTGWVPDDHSLAPCILLADLELIFDTLASVGQRVHYLRRRADLEDHMSYMGDELDLLGLYIQTGFNVGGAEFGEYHLQLTGMSSTIDKYYIAKAEKIRATKPALRLTAWWRDICNKVEQRGFYQWTDIAMILLGMAFDDQKKIEKLFKHVKKNIHKKWREPGHQCAAIMTPNFNRFDAIALYGFKLRNASERHERMRDVAGQAFKADHVKRCLVLATNVDGDSYPYATLAVFSSESLDDNSGRDDLMVY